MSDYDADVAVIGAGILGLSTAMALATRHDGLRVVALEQESGVGRHQSGNNSGVIHSGLYYRPGSAKARMAVAGAERMYAFCDEHGIGAERCGKVVVATHDSELERMRELHRRGDAHRGAAIPGRGPHPQRAVEPHAPRRAPQPNPTPALADYRSVCEKYRELLESASGSVRLRSRVSGVRVDADGVQLATTSGMVQAKYAVNCAGLQADRIARGAGAPEARDLRIVPFRGEYYDLVPAARGMLRNLIYPVPDPAFPFLGVHFTRR
ncbi:MAG: FAD-dependent oxidoreductase, partial [Chloroflexi bacterium]|nr:FAD-dependent oxidoreductase [Chloroflexota bacterium]